jgi:tetratricopeptide (TPR) repeat protein
MGFAPASRRSRRSSLASVCALALLTLGSIAHAAPGRSLLVLPVRAPEELAAAAETLTRALPQALRERGFEPVVAAPDSAFVQLAARDGWLSEAETAADMLPENRYFLGLLAHTDAVLSVALTATEAEAEVGGTLSQQTAVLRVAGTAPAALAKGLAAALTSEVWSRLGLDQAARRAAATARFAAGNAAMGAGRFTAAAREFELACAADPDNATYLQASADALAAKQDYGAAFLRARRVCTLRPDDRIAKFALADLALRAGHPEQAEVVYRGLAASTPEDPRALEGLAWAARARGDSGRAQEYFQRLVAALPDLADEPAYLSALLASQRDEGLRLAGLRRDEQRLQLVRIYFQSGDVTRGTQVLSSCHQEAKRPAYAEADYVLLAQGLEAEAEAVARAAEKALSAVRLNRAGADKAAATLEGLHDRSNRLADLGEAMLAPPSLEAAHRFRALAYNALNESTFEAQRYVQTGVEDHWRRSALLRDAVRTALKSAHDLAQSPEATVPLPELPAPVAE